jgi:nucleotide-binding universal stress UspA family protein
MHRHIKNLLAQRPAVGLLPLDGDVRNLHSETGARIAAPAPVHVRQKFRSILVPVDGTPFGEHAIPVALGIAERAGAEVTLVHIHAPLQFESHANRLYPDGVVDEWLLRERRDCLNGLLRRTASSTSVRVRAMLVDGPEIAESLCRAAALARADLVVMATHGRGPLGRLWFGSVADAMMQRLPTPVLFVRGSDAPATLTKASAFRHVLIPLDGSKRAEEVVPTALALGQLSDALHTLIRIVPLEVDCSLHYAPLARPLPQPKREAEASKYIGDVMSRLQMDPARVRARTVFDDRPMAEAILQYARRREADLIALATRGRGSLSRLFQQSVVDRVVRNATVPILVHRSTGG